MPGLVSRTVSRLALAAAVAHPLILPANAGAQGELQGRVLADSGRQRVKNAEVSIPRLDLRVASDSAGRYRLERIPPGEHLVVTRAVGFRPDSTLALFDANETVVRDVMLRPAVASLEEVRVEGRAAPVGNLRLAAYERRKATGIGHFIDRSIFEQDSVRRLSDILSARVPGLTVHRGGRSRAWAATGRGGTNAKCALCRVDKAEVLDKLDMAAGAPLACYVDVYLDGAIVYSTGAGQRPLFNLNSITPHHIEAIEVYTSASQIPSQFVRTGNDCGVMVIWTRNTR